MVNGPVVLIGSRECNDFVAQCVGERIEHFPMCAWGEARVGDLVTAVEDHAAGAFQEFSLRFKMGQINHFLDIEIASERIDNVGASFQPAVFGHHRV
ncbi:hypothetical protein D3C87_1746590 [compost metagenome]